MLKHIIAEFKLFLLCLKVSIELQNREYLISTFPIRTIDNECNPDKSSGHYIKK